MIYTQGNEPEELKKYINFLLRELKTTYPDGLVIMDIWNHEKWDKIAGYLVKKLGYPNGTAFLEAYGFEVFKDDEPEENEYVVTPKEAAKDKIPKKDSDEYIQTKTVSRQEQKRLRCPQCEGIDIQIESFQENVGTTTVSKSKSKFKQSGHGLFWWLFIGWWWWAIDLFLWIFLFVPRLVLQLFKKKKYKGKATTVSQSINEIVYKKMFTCRECGYSWMKEDGKGTVLSEASKTKQNIKNMKKMLKP